MKDLRPETCYFFWGDPKISLRILAKSSLSEIIFVDLTWIMWLGIFTAKSFFLLKVNRERYV
jgi:hypothetical protein